MGKIRPSHIKSIAKDILEKYSDLIADDFEKNKELLDQILDVKSKRLRNRIAGYLTSLISVEENKQYVVDNDDF
ncbi:MAG: 30S ribosomal protein S17e [Promethearchaeota archaeon]